MIEKCDLSSFSSCDLRIYILRSKLQNPWERRRRKINGDQRTRRGNGNKNWQKKKKKKKRYRSCGRKGEEGGRGVARQRGIKHGTRSNSYKMRMFRNVKHAERRRNRRACDDVRIPNRELQMSAQPSWRWFLPPLIFIVSHGGCILVFQQAGFIRPLVKLQGTSRTMMFRWFIANRSPALFRSMSPITYPLTLYARILFSLVRPCNAVISSLLIYKLADRFINSSFLFFTLPFLSSFFFSQLYRNKN